MPEFKADLSSEKQSAEKHAKYIAIYTKPYLLFFKLSHGSEKSYWKHRFKVFA